MGMTNCHTVIVVLRYTPLTLSQDSEPNPKSFHSSLISLYLYALCTLGDYSLHDNLPNGTFSFDPNLNHSKTLT